MLGETFLFFSLRNILGEGIDTLGAKIFHFQSNNFSLLSKFLRDSKTLNDDLDKSNY